MAGLDSYSRYTIDILSTTTSVVVYTILRRISEWSLK
jgi:hypothetical protein